MGDEIASVLGAALLTACATAKPKTVTPTTPDPNASIENTVEAPPEPESEPEPEAVPAYQPTTTGALPAGTTFTVARIAPDDAYFSSAASIIGLTCTANAEMHENEPGLYGGDATCSDGQGYYFYAAGFSGIVLGSGATTGVTGGVSGGVVGGTTTSADPDRDYDGIPDRTDSCPDSPEDRDMDKDYDGCPE